MTRDLSNPFTRVPISSPINFSTPGSAAGADIVVNDTAMYQQIDGFGASLSEFVQDI